MGISRIEGTSGSCLCFILSLLFGLILAALHHHIAATHMKRAQSLLTLTPSLTLTLLSYFTFLFLFFFLLFAFTASTRVMLYEDHTLLPNIM